MLTPSSSQIFTAVETRGTWAPVSQSAIVDRGTPVRSDTCWSVSPASSLAALTTCMPRIPLAPLARPT